MPAKNADRYISTCIDSILNQSYLNWELIVIDDNSTDKTFEILTAYQKQDERINILNNTGSGIIEALQLAFSNCNGNLITRMDADDIMTPDKLEKLSMALLQNGRGNVSIGLVKYFSENALGDGYKKYEIWLNSLTLKSSNYNDIYKECVIPSPCWMIHKEDLIKVGAFEGMYPEDYDLCFRFRKSGIKVIGIPKVLHHWRDYSSRTSRTDNNYADNSFLNLKVYHLLKQDYDSEKQMILWGAGKKGKIIAQKLIENDVDFVWICDNPKKIGHVIYGKKLEEIPKHNLPSPCQIIISVAQKGEQKKINELLSLKSQENDHVFWFC